jgi:hypothetical protein
MPRLLKTKLKMTKVNVLIFVNPASIETPISSGKGEAMIIPAKTYVK